VIGGADPQLPPVLEGFDGVDDDVQEDLRELTGKSLHGGEIRRQPHHQLNVRLLQTLVGEGQGVLHRFVEVHLHGDARSRTVEIQHPPHDAHQMIDFLAGDAEVALPFRLVEVGVCGEMHTVLHGLQWIVDFMGDGGGQSADRGHLLCLDQLVLGALQGFGEGGQFAVEPRIFHRHRDARGNPFQDGQALRVERFGLPHHGEQADGFIVHDQGDVQQVERREAQHF